MPPNQQPEWPVEIIRSAQRQKTVSARLQDGTLVVRAPAHISDAELAEVVEKLKQRMVRRVERAPESDVELEQRARELNHKYFGGKLKWRSIRYVTNQNSRFGSCTPEDGTIRISHRVASYPPFVRDYVVMHEIAHLVEANHGRRFWKLVNRYPLTERARGYLMAVGLEGLDESPAV